MLFLITLFSFVTVTLSVWGFFYLLTRDRELVRERVERFAAAAVSGREREGAGREAGLGTDGSTSLRRLLRSLARLVEARSISERIELEIQKAGLSWKGGEFVALMALLSLAGSFVGFWFGGTLTLLMGLGAGLVLPRVWLKFVAAKRLRAFNDQITDALTMVSSSLKAGYSFLQAMEMVAREMPAPICEEFTRALKEMSLGMPTAEALEGMSERVGSDDLDLVVTAVLIQRQVGGNLAEVLDNIAHTVRERIRIKGEIKTLTAQGRISGLIIAFLPVGIGLFISAVNPGYIAPLFYSPLGRLMLGAGVVGEIIGVIFIKKIVSIEV